MALIITGVVGTSANGASTVVARDAAGSFAGNVITGVTFSGSGASLTSLPAGQLSGTIPSGVLGNSSLNIGTTSVALNRASSNLGLTGISSIALPGSSSGTVTLQPAAAAGTTTITLPATTGTVVTTGDTGTVTNAMLAGSIANAKLTNSSITVNGTAISLGASGTITASTTNALTIGSGLSGSSFNGGSAVTIAVDSTVALRADTHFIGTTSVALNRASGNLGLTGITSVAMPGATSGTVTLQPAATAGATTITLPATTGTVVTTGDTGTVTNAMLAGSIATSKITGLATSATTDTTNASNISSGTLPGGRGVASGSTTVSFISYNGTTSSAGQFDGGSTNPSGTTRVNYGGYLYATRYYTSGIYDLTGTSGTPTIYPDVTTGTITIGGGLTTGTLNLGSGTAGAKNVTIGTSTGTTVIDGSTVRLPSAGTPGAGKYLQSDASGNATWQTVVAGATITNDTTTNSDAYYPGMATAISGAWTAAYVSSTKLYFNPSTGTLNATVFNSLSDVNAKENIVKIDAATSTIAKIDGVEFTWKDNGNKSAGVIAQELEKVLPHLVAESSEGTKSVNYSGIIAYLIESVKELTARVEELEKQK